MKEYGFFELLLARSPSRLVRFPDPPVERALAELATLKAELVRADDSVPPAKVEGVDTAAASDPLDAALAALATNVWRAEGRLVDPTTGEPREETRRIHRHVEGAREALQQIDVRLSDWQGQPFDAGLPLKVLSFQPTSDVVRDTIIEVVRPAVFWRDRLLQVGEVVVGIPESPSQPQS